MSAGGAYEATAGFATRQVHAGGPGDPAGAVAAPGAVAPRATPVYLTAGFRFEDYEEAEAHFADGAGFGYTRTGNPTTTATERKIAALESGADAVLVASGQAASALAVMASVGAGQRLLSATSMYEGTRGLFLDVLPRFGVETDFVQTPRDLDAWRAAIRPETRALFLESIPNPRNDLADIAAIADLAHEHGLPLIVDNTLATPYLLRPIEHGADVVVHSASKFLAGHGSVLGGVVVDSGRFDAGHGHLFPHLTASPRVGGPSLVERHGPLARAAYLRDELTPRLGPTPSPWHAFLIAQGIETLSLRMARQSAVALEVAGWLEARPEVASVDYSGLPGNASHDLARRYLPEGQGSVFAITLDTDAAGARRFVEGLRLITHMTHLGDVRSLVLHPATTSHVQRTPEEQRAAGIEPGTLRLSIGIEEPADLIADLERALAGVAPGAGR